jgi:pimeloyl-ACP methyl ester carboxylesterase
MRCHGPNANAGNYYTLSGGERFPPNTKDVVLADGKAHGWLDDPALASGSAGVWDIDLRRWLRWSDRPLVDVKGKVVVTETLLLGQHMLRVPQCCAGGPQTGKLIEKLPEFEISFGWTHGSSLAVRPSGVTFIGKVKDHTIVRYQSSFSDSAYVLSTKEGGNGGDGIFSPTSPILYGGQWFPKLGWVNQVQGFHTDDKGRILALATFNLEHDLSERVWILLLITPKGVHVPTSVPAPPIMVDPVTIPTASAPLAKVVTNPSDLVKARQVVGIAADGVARTVIGIPTLKVSDDVKVEICASKEDASKEGAKTCGTLNAEEYGLLANIGDIQTDLTKTNKPLQPINSAAVPGATDPYAFVVYRAPLDFTRRAVGGAAALVDPSCPTGYNQEDCKAPSRSIFLRITYANGAHPPPYEIKVVRPPVVLVHGYASDACSWSTFTPLVGSTSIFSTTLIDYSGPVKIVSTIPWYGTLVSSGTVPANTIGIEWNAHNVLPTIVSSLVAFRLGNPGYIAEAGTTNVIPNRLNCLPSDQAKTDQVAAIQVDVVGHSMGGLIAKAMLQDPSYLTQTPFRSGLMHKLITLGTPHLGSQYAMRLLDGNNECVRLATADSTNKFTSSPSLFFLSLALADSPSSVSGATADLRGNGKELDDQDWSWKDHPFLIKIRTVPTLVPSPPIALVAAIASTPQFNNIDLVQTWAYWGAAACKIKGDFLADNYSGGLWGRIFGMSPNDGFVAQSSALDGRTPGTPGTKVVVGFAHGHGTVDDIGIGAPSLPDGGLVSAWTINLLNSSVGDSKVFIHNYGKPQ